MNGKYVLETFINDSARISITVHSYWIHTLSSPFLYNPCQVLLVSLPDVTADGCGDSLHADNRFFIQRMTSDVTYIGLVPEP